jgi:hypothetical protein
MLIVDGQIHLWEKGAPDFFVGRIHPGNVSPKQTRDRRWRAVPYEGIRAMLGEGLSRGLAS